MEEQELTTLWNLVLSVLETEVSRATYKTLFKNTSLVTIDDNVALVAAPSTMIIDLIRKRFATIITKTLEKHTGKNLELTFIPRIVQKEEKAHSMGPLFNEEIKSSGPSLARVLSRVRSDYTFQTMAVSSSNQLAYVSAQTVSKNPGKSYNPLFVYGPVGVGKTHLMHAIANEVFQKDPLKKILCITSEEFTNEVVDAIRTNQTSAMKKKFRNIDLLIIDDVQFIAGKDKVQEELFHTFNILIDNNSQIVLSSDRPPQEIKKLEKRLSSRFAGGLTVDVETPDFELRCAILLIKAKKFGVDLPIEAAKTIAQKTQDARLLEGMLLQIITEASTQNKDIADVAQEKALREQDKYQGRAHTEDIIKNVCSFYGVKPTQLKGPRRTSSLVHARQICMYLLKKELRLPLVEIGNALGGRDHTTIIHGVSKIELLLSSRQNIQEEVRGITLLLRV